VTKPKGKTPSLLSMSTGKPLVYICKKKSKCSRCKNDIIKNYKCFQIPKASSGFTSKKIFCVACTTEIVEQSKKDIAKIENEISAV
jgi:ferredoxin